MKDRKLQYIHTEDGRYREIVAERERERERERQ
jgi:hypothetical protein